MQFQAQPHNSVMMQADAARQAILLPSKGKCWGPAGENGGKALVWRSAWARPGSSPVRIAGSSREGDCCSSITAIVPLAHGDSILLSLHAQL
jgi:hypothetical protein